MNKIGKVIGGVALSMALIATPANLEKVNAAENEIDYQTYFDVDSVTFEEFNVLINDNQESITRIVVVDQNGKRLFSVKKEEEIVYTSVGLNLRSVPTINSTPEVAYAAGTEIKRVGNTGFGWDIVEVDGKNYFMWDEYLTTEEPVINNVDYVSTDSYNNYYNVSYDYSTDYSDYSGYSSSAKEEIARRESGGSYDARNGKYIGRYQLDSSYLNGDYSPENQERVADQYVMDRYGSWEAALDFWNANGWY